MIYDANPGALCTQAHALYTCTVRRVTYTIYVIRMYLIRIRFKYHFRLFPTSSPSTLIRNLCSAVFGFSSSCFILCKYGRFSSSEHIMMLFNLCVVAVCFFFVFCKAAVDSLPHKKNEPGFDVQEKLLLRNMLQNLSKNNERRFSSCIFIQN